MIKTTLSFLLLILSLQIFAQTKSKISLEVSYGLQGNFFVRSYNENGRPDGTAFLNKSFTKNSLLKK